MTESNASATRSPRRPLPKAFGIPIVVALILFFIALTFPWDSLARRIAWEISAASGSQISIDHLAPALTGRGPVLRAQNVLIEHPAIDQVRLSELEIAPRWSSSWLRGDPTLRVWADGALGRVDGILELGSTPGFIGKVDRVELARVPLRLEASGIRVSGELETEADVVLSRNGTLRGRMDFSSQTLRIESDQLPMAIPFSHAEGTIVILENGATRIETVALEGEILEGELSGEIGLVHHSQAPPVELEATIRIIHPLLRQLAPSAGLPVAANGEVAIRVSGSLDAPSITPLATATPTANRARDTTARGRP